MLTCYYCEKELQTPYMVVFPDEDGIPADEHLCCSVCLLDWYNSGYPAWFYVGKDSTIPTLWAKVARVGSRWLRISDFPDEKR